MDSFEPLSKKPRGNDLNNNNGYGFAPASEMNNAAAPPPAMYSSMPMSAMAPTNNDNNHPMPPYYPENGDQDCRRYNTPEGCQYGSNCRFKHGPIDTRELTQSVPASGGKSKPCTKFFSTAGCQYGDGCHFLHYVPGGINALVLRPQNNLGSVVMAGPVRKQAIASADPSLRVNGYKTKLCNKYGTPDGCHFGDKCHFAHGEADLRPSISHYPISQVMSTAPGIQTANGMYNLTPAVYNNDTSATYGSSTKSAKYTNAASYTNPLPDTVYYSEPTPPGVNAAMPPAPNSVVPAANPTPMIGSGASMAVDLANSGNLQFYS